MKRLDFADLAADVGDQAFRRAVVGGHDVEHLLDHLPAAFGIVERQRPARESRAPHLPRDHRHLRLDAGRLALGFIENLRRGQSCVQLEIELVREQCRTDPPVIAGARKDLGLEKLEESIQATRRSARLSSSARYGPAARPPA